MCDVAEVEFPVMKNISERRWYGSICADVRLETGRGKFLKLPRRLHLAHQYTLEVKEARSHGTGQSHLLN